MTSLITITLSIALSTSLAAQGKESTSSNTPFNENVPVTDGSYRADDWRIPSARAQTMVEYYKSCTGDACLPYKKITKSKAVKSEIRAANDIARINFRLHRIKARYTKEDEERYRRLRGMKEDEPRGNVAGYSTKILRVRAKKNHQSTTGMNSNQPREFEDFLYYDFESICPPPDLC